MKQQSNRPLAAYHHPFFTVIFAIFSAYAFLHWNDPAFLLAKPSGHSLHAPTTAFITLFLTIYCGIGFTIYTDQLVVRIFGLPLRTFFWDQFSAVECIIPKERTQMTKLRFHMKSRSSRKLTVPIPNKYRDNCMRTLMECLGPIWMPAESGERL